MQDLQATRKVNYLHHDCTIKTEDILPPPYRLFGSDVEGVEQFSKWYPGQDKTMSKLIEWLYGPKRFMCASLPTGSGKCHPQGTKVITDTGEFINVEDVESGMFLMGPDSSPRYVTSTSCGYGPIFKINTSKKVNPGTATKITF